LFCNAGAKVDYFCYFCGNLKLETRMKRFCVIFLSLFLLLTFTARTQIPTNGLKGYWKLDGDVTDASGNNNNGTLQGGAVYCEDRFGTANSAVKFGGYNHPAVYTQPSMFNDTINDKACLGEKYEKNGFFLPAQNTTGLHTFSRTNGCDSTWVLNLNVLPCDFKADFFANNILYSELSTHLFCVKKIDFSTEIEGLNSSSGSLKWFINGAEEISAQDKLTWSKTFATGEYKIEMRVLFENGKTETLTATLNIGGIVSTSALPFIGGTTAGDGCFKAGSPINVTANPNPSYEFVNWTESGTTVSTNSSYSFTVTNDRTLTANFKLNSSDSLDFDTYTVIICNKVILLNLKKLEEDGFDIAGCKWFKNGIEQKNTHTINEFSYSEGADKTKTGVFGNTTPKLLSVRCLYALRSILFC